MHIDDVRVDMVFGPSEWLTVTQEQVDLFADSTDDHAWLHTDPERAARSHLGGTIAHGFLTLSLIARPYADLVGIKGTRTGYNYGLNKVRFPAPLPVGRRIRSSYRISSIRDLDDRGIEVVATATTELEGSDKPVCVAELVTRYYR